MLGRKSFHGTPSRQPGTPGRRKRTNKPSEFNGSFRDSFRDPGDGYTMESYGGALPVTVTEALAKSAGPGSDSVGVNASEWAWLVNGPRVLLWKLAESRSVKPGACKELTISHSTPGFTADHVCVYESSLSANRVTTSCVCVSPEGLVRLWPNVMHEYTYMETDASDMIGDGAVVSVICAAGQGVVFATDTSSLFSLEVTQTSVKCVPMGSSGGLLSGLGRRVSSMFFSRGQPEPQSLFRLIAMDTSRMGGAFGGSASSGAYCAVAVVLTDKNLQVWDVEGRQLLSELNLNEAVSLAVLQLCSNDKTSSYKPSGRVWLIDTQPTRVGIVVLAAFEDARGHAQFMAVTLTMEEGLSPQPPSITSCEPLALSIDFSGDTSVLSSYRLALPNTHSGYVFTQTCVHWVSIADGSLPTQAVDFSHKPILGSGTIDGRSVFFTKRDGFVTIKRLAGGGDVTDFSLISKSLHHDQSIHQQTLGLDSSLSQQGGIMTTSSDAILELSRSSRPSDHLKAAFYAWVKEGEPPGAFFLRQTGVQLEDLDRSVVEVCRGMLDEIPANDPRWAEAGRTRGVAPQSFSLLISNQLEDKFTLLNLFINFLNSAELWQKLGSFQKSGTRETVFEYAEKVLAAKAIRILETGTGNEAAETLPKLIHQAIETACENREQISTLTPQDLYYREVSKMEAVFEALGNVQSEEMKQSTESSTRVIMDVNTILIAVMFEINKYKQSALSSDLYGASKVMTWAYSGSPQGVKAFMEKQYTLSVEQAIPDSPAGVTTSDLYRQLTDLADIILDAHVFSLSAIRSEERYTVEKDRYHSARYQLLKPLVEYEQFERACMLAEKYCDFRILVDVCELSDNAERLRKYQEQFDDMGFSNFLFQYYMENGKRSKLLSQPASQTNRLRDFLASYSPSSTVSSADKLELCWLHDLNNGEFMKAHQSLMELAGEETEYLGKRKTLLSLSKLTALAADNDVSQTQTRTAQPDLVKRLQVVNVAQKILCYQETLPKDVLDALGMEEDTMRVLTPVEVIEAYIGENNPYATVTHFTKALEILACLKTSAEAERAAARHSDSEDESDDEDEAGEEVLRMGLRVWARAVLREEDWEKVDTSSVHSMERVFFWKLIDAVYQGERHLLNLLPKGDDLLSLPDLAHLSDNSGLQYVVKAAYEHLDDAMEA